MIAERRYFVYRAWDSEGRPLYVGCTGNPTKRYANHRSTSKWFPYAVRFDMIGPFDKATALEREQGHIMSLCPFFNALPSHALMGRRRSRRISELQAQMYQEAGLTTGEQIHAALLSESPILEPIWAAAEAIADSEFDLRCTHTGRIKYYEALIAGVAA